MTSSQTATQRKPMQLIAFGGDVFGAHTVRARTRVSLGVQFSAVTLLALLWFGGARGQTTLLSEGFEGAFPAAWSTGDLNASGGLVFWKDVFTGFGGVPAHSGFWKGYCAGISNGIPVSVAGYATNMQAYMSQPISLAGYSGANLSF